jgi:hypothetical protein
MNNLKKYIKLLIEARLDFIAQAKAIPDLEVFDKKTNIVFFLKNTNQSVIDDVDKQLRDLAAKNDFVLLSAHPDDGTFFDKQSRGYVWQFTPSDDSPEKRKYFVSDLPHFVYHVTTIASIWSIVRFGLKPSVRADNSTRAVLGREGVRMKYAPRIYFGRDQYVAEIYADQLDVSHDADIVTLTIDTSLLPPDLVVYLDEEYTDYPGYEKELPPAMYITKPIPAKALRAADPVPFNDGPVDANEVDAFTKKPLKNRDHTYLVKCGLLFAFLYDNKTPKAIFNKNHWRRL